MADVVFVAATAAFFLTASGFVTLCDRILGNDSPPPTRSRSKEGPTVEAGESADVDVTELKGVRAR